MHGIGSLSSPCDARILPIAARLGRPRRRRGGRRRRGPATSAAANDDHASSSRRPLGGAEQRQRRRRASPRATSTSATPRASSSSARRSSSARSRRSTSACPRSSSGEATGSGFVLDEHGTILTNAHVVDGATKVTRPVRRQAERRARRCVGQGRVDRPRAAAGRPDGPQPHAADRSATRNGVQVGDPAIAIGNPFGLERTLTTGVISAAPAHDPGAQRLRDRRRASRPTRRSTPATPAARSSTRPASVIGINSQIATGGSGQRQRRHRLRRADRHRQADHPRAQAVRARRPRLPRDRLGHDRQDAQGPQPARRARRAGAVGHARAARPTRRASAAATSARRSTTTPIQLGGDIIIKVAGKDIRTSDDLQAASRTASRATRSRSRWCARQGQDASRSRSASVPRHGDQPSPSTVRWGACPRDAASHQALRHHLAATTRCSRSSAGAWAVGLHPVARLAAGLRSGRGRRASRQRCAGAPTSAACSSTRRSTRSPAWWTGIGLTMVQLHGDEGPAFCAEVARRTGAKVIKAAPVRGRADIRALEAFHTDYHLLDAASQRDARRDGGDLRLGARAHAPLEDPARAQRRACAPRTSPRRSPPCARSRSTRPAAPRPARGSRTPRRWRPSWRRSRPRTGAGGRASGVRMMRRPPAVEHRFGPYGGQYVPETLMPALAELEEAWVAARERRRLPRRARRPAARLRRAPVAAVPRPPPQRGRRPAPVPQARGPQPHRRAQDQQRPRPGAAGPAHGQAAHHRRDRRGPARRRHRDRVRADGPRVRRLHGRRGHPPPGAQRPAHGAARRDRVAGRRRRAHPQGGGLGGDPRLGHQRRHHALHHRLGGRPGALPGARARPAAGDRRRGARADPRARGPPARPRHRLRRRRLQRDRHLRALRRRRGRRAHRRRGRRRGARARPPRRAAHRRRAPRRAARIAVGRAAGRDGPDPRGPLDLGRPGLPRQRPRARAPARHRPRDLPRGHRRRGAGDVPARHAPGGDHPGARDRPRPAPRAAARRLRARHRVLLGPRRQGPGRGPRAGIPAARRTRAS